MQKFLSWAKSASGLLVLIIVFSVLVRLACAFYLGDKVEDMPGTFDQISYHLLAQRVLGGYGFSFGQNWWPLTAADEPTAHWSFLYTFYLVFVYLIFGAHPLAARVIQAIIFGILQPYLTYRIGTRLFGKATGLVAALLAAGYAYFIYYGGTLMTEPFYILAILLLMDISIHLVTIPESDRRFNRWLLLGCGMGIAVLLRQVFLLIIPFILLWIGWAISRRKHYFPVIKLAMPVIVVALMIMPFTIFNASRFGSTVLLNTNAGYAFFWGNHPYHGTDFISILPSEQYRELIPVELRGLDEAVLDRALLERGVENVMEDPVRYILLSLGRIPDFFMFWPSPDSGTISNVSRVVSFGILWPFMLAGLILSIRDIHGRLVAILVSPVFLLVMFIILYSAVHILTWTLIRYRLPVDAIALIFAGFIFVKIDQHVLHINQRLFDIDETPEPREVTG